MAKYFIGAFALASSVFAQSSPCSGTVTVASTADVTSQLAGCGVYNGTIIIDSSATGTLDLGSVQQIKGDLTCNNATGLTSITAGSLSTIAGTFELQGLITLSNLNMPYLKAVDTITWVALPQLQGLNFATGISQANTVYISNTQLNTLEGIELSMVGSIDVNNNPYLNEINVNDLTNITRALNFAANGNTLNVELPNLQNAGNLTFRNVSSVSIPSLSMVEGYVGLYSNYFQNFSAPNLSTIGQSLAVIDCASLTTFSFPQLTEISGGFIVVNNSQLASINNIGKLVTVVGAIEFIGTFSSVDAGALKDVRGGATVITSSQNQTICTVFDNARAHSIIKGSENCQYGTVTPQTNGSSSSNSTGGKKNAAATLTMAPIVPFTSFIGFLAYMLL